MGTVGLFTVTSRPGASEKWCAACEYWQGERSPSFSDYSATAKKEMANCSVMRKATSPEWTCQCGKFKKWHRLR